jgi:hypothetical protein
VIILRLEGRLPETTKLQRRLDQFGRFPADVATKPPVGPMRFCPTTRASNRQRIWSSILDLVWRTKTAPPTAAFRNRIPSALVVADHRALSYPARRAPSHLRNNGDRDLHAGHANRQLRPLACRWIGRKPPHPLLIHAREIFFLEQNNGCTSNFVQ